MLPESDARWVDSTVRTQSTGLLSCQYFKRGDWSAFISLLYPVTPHRNHVSASRVSFGDSARLMRVHNEKYIEVCILGPKARLQSVCLAQQKKEGDHHQSKEEQTRHKTAPNESINHVFGLKVQRAPGAAARRLLQHIVTISTSLCAHGRWSTDF